MPGSRGRSNFSQLSDDLVSVILVQLSPREVVRSRLVCRRWRAIATDHHLLRTSFWRHRGHSVAGMFVNGIGDSVPLRKHAVAGDCIPLLEHAGAGDRGSLPDLSFVFLESFAEPGSGSIHIFSSCHGLLLLVCWTSCCQCITYVCNPLTKKAVIIPLPIDFMKSLTLAYDPSKSQHYKIVALEVFDTIYVYDSETRSWRTPICWGWGTAGPFRGLWNGSIVWIVEHSLVRFQIEEEHVTKMRMPPRKEGWICAYIGESGGHLQMIGYTKKDKLAACFDILEMQGNRSSEGEWSVLYRVDLSRVKELYPNIERPTFSTRHSPEKIMDYLALSPIYVIRGTGKTGQHGLLIFSIPGKIMVYNMADKQISIVPEIMIPLIAQQASLLEQFWYNFFAYSPSLFNL